MPTKELAKSIQQHANQCVKCGLCLPHCPTYAITENECESPRGRIALLDALAKQQIPLSAKTELYLDHCLTCRACEAVCPAKVNYGELIDQGREFILEQNKQKKPLPKILDSFLKHPQLWHLLTRLLQIYQCSGLQYLTRKSGLLKALGLQAADLLLPSSIKVHRLRIFYPTTVAKRGQVALFTGCINKLIDQVTLQASINVLTACGYDVYIPPKQQCCGALHQHAGVQEQAQLFAKANIEIFNQLNIESIITLASGCGATLQEYAQRLPLTPSTSFSTKVVDISTFLISKAKLETLTLRPLPKRVVIHTPCTLRNVLKQPQAPIQLLKYIPKLEIITLPNNAPCCGAAGQYMLQHSAMADDLLNKILQEVIPFNPDYLVTSNIGCALHLQKGLNENRLKTRVLHPIAILAEQLK